MKKTLFLLFVISSFLFSSSIFAQNVTFDDGVAWNCNQYFSPTPVRYWKMYSFYDTWNNDTNQTTYLNKYEYQFQNASYLSRGAAFPDGTLFDWTSTLRNASYAVAPHSSMKVLSTQYEDWGIVKKPATRSNPAIGQYDFMIAYKIAYDKSNNYPDASDDVSHVECQPYYVTWCGDGVKDPAYEQCDGNDGITTGQTCNNSCQIENNTAPVCISLSSSVLIGNQPVSTNVSCATQNATSVQIECGNGQSINSASGTCTYTSPGYYSAVCKVNGSITNANCQKNIQVNPTPVPPVCEPSRTGAQSSPLTQGYCNVGTSYNFTATGSNPVNYTWTCNNASQSVNCSANYNSNTPPPGSFDLSLKKYIASDDAQVSPGIQTANAAKLEYKIIVTNKGPATSSGVTTVQDILPAGVLFSGSGVWNNGSWNCTYTAAGTVVRCLSSQSVVSGGVYDTITIPFTVTASAGTTVLNIAAVDNPNEWNRCNANGSMPENSASSCTKDTTNSDPAYFYVPSGGGGGGGSSHVGKICVNGIASCASYNSIVACEQAVGVGKCYSADAVGQKMCQDQVLSCSGGGGGGGRGGGGGGGSCGNGVLQPNSGEECDVVGASWCVNCKITGFTNPGANPLMDMWVKVPHLAGTSNRIGYTSVDAGKNLIIPLSTYKIVTGVGGNVFTLPDTIVLGMRTQYRAPIMIPADKKFCLQADGTSINSPHGICMTAGDIGVTSVNGKDYVILGEGDVQIRKVDGTYESYQIQNAQSEITLFKGSTQYTPIDGANLGPTLRDAFIGVQNGSDSQINLFTCAGSNCAPSAITSLAVIPVRVSGAMVSSIGSVSNRIEHMFLPASSLFADFLGTTYISSVTTVNNNGLSARPIRILPELGGMTGNQSSSGTTDMERFAVNGNKNILSVQGNLVIENCPSGTFVMTGVRSVIVTGDLIIKCNIAYGAQDATSSWAWIVKGGNIKIYNGFGTPNVGAITNLAGVYVAIKEASGGDIGFTGATTTSAILRLEGTLYGNAKPLFDSRLYARATGAYDILTTGTILTYSNRALINPPPLLSQYLGNYQVDRVVQ